MEQTHYEVLEVSETASDEEIRKAYRQLARKYHPDRPDGDSARFAQINEAYTVISDANKRAQYDSHLRFVRQFGAASGSAGGAGGFSGGGFNAANFDPSMFATFSQNAGSYNGVHMDGDRIYVSPDDLFRDFFYAASNSSSSTYAQGMNDAQYDFLRAFFNMPSSQPEKLDEKELAEAAKWRTLSSRVLRWVMISLLVSLVVLPFVAPFWTEPLVLFSPLLLVIQRFNINFVSLKSFNFWPASNLTNLWIILQIGLLLEIVVLFSFQWRGALVFLALVLNLGGASFYQLFAARRARWHERRARENSR